MIKFITYHFISQLGNLLQDFLLQDLTLLNNSITAIFLLFQGYQKRNDLNGSN